MAKKARLSAEEEATASAQRSADRFHKINFDNCVHSLSVSRDVVTATVHNLKALGMWKEKQQKRTRNCHEPAVTSKPENESPTKLAQKLETRNQHLALWRARPLIVGSAFASKMDDSIHRNFEPWSRVPPTTLCMALATAEPISLDEALLKAKLCNKHQKVPSQDVLLQILENITDIDPSERLDEHRTLLDVCQRVIEANERMATNARRCGCRLIGMAKTRCCL